MALEKPLREHGLNSERLLWPSKASKFEDEVANLEQKVGLTTLAKAVAWAQTNSMWPDPFGRWTTTSHSATISSISSITLECPRRRAIPV